jgi:hypothetical protein
MSFWEQQQQDQSVDQAKKAPETTTLADQIKQVDTQLAQVEKNVTPEELAQLERHEQWLTWVAEMMKDRIRWVAETLQQTTRSLFELRMQIMWSQQQVA